MEGANEVVSFNFTAIAHMCAKVAAIGVNESWLPILTAPQNQIASEILKRFNFSYGQFVGIASHKPAIWVRQNIEISHFYGGDIIQFSHSPFGEFFPSERLQYLPNTYWGCSCIFLLNVTHIGSFQILNTRFAFSRKNFGQTFSLNGTFSISEKIRSRDNPIGK